MSIVSVDNIQPIGSGTSVTVNSAATLVLTNANITGVTTVGTGLDLNDNIKIRLGTGNDLSIYHDGSHSIIEDTGTGNLFLRSDSVVSIRGTTIALKNAANTETLLQCVENGAVDLYYNNSKKLETNSTGAKVYGALLVDSVLDISPPGNNAVLIKNPANGIIGFGANNQTNQVIITTDGHLGITADSKELRLGASEDLKLFHDGTHSRITNSTGFLALQSDSFRLYNAAGSENMIDGTANGSVNLYYDNSKKFETMSTGARIQGGLLFNSDTAAANTLDDYEEGSWTPDWRGSQALGTTTYGTYNVASYVKVGNQVTIRGTSQIRGTSGGQGFWFINNLPFTVGGGDDRRYRSVGSVMIENFNLPDDVLDVVLYVERNNNDAQLRSNRDNAQSGAGISVNNDTNFEIFFTVTYPTA